MNQKQKSILVVTELYPNTDNSFLGTFVVNQLQELRHYYHIVVIVPYAIGLREWMLNKKQKPIHLNNFTVYYIPQYPLMLLLLRTFKILDWPAVSYWNKKYIAPKILRLAKKLHDKYQFSLVHGHESYIGDEATIIGQILRIPSIVTIHGLYDYHKQGFGGKVMKRVVSNLNRADRLFAVSKIAATSYQQNGVNHEIDIVPNGIDERALKAMKPIPEKWQKIIKGKTVILTVGFFVKEKRFEQVIEAAAKLKEKYGGSFAILMIGRGELESRYKKLIKEKCLENHIYIVGQIPPNEMMSYYNACDFLVHPSIIESFSMACLEAASAGKPFICTSNIGLTEYITPNKEAFIIPPDNIEALTEKMDILLSSANLRKQMGEAGRETAQKFIWKNQIHQTLSIYEQLIQAK